MATMIKQPSAWLPIALSLSMLAALIAYFAMHWPPVRESDEGTMAHLFQLWLGAEILMVGFFVVRWAARSPRSSAPILAMQIGAIIAACAPVFYFHL